MSIARISQIEHGEVTSFEVIALADFGDRAVRLPVTDATATAA